MTADISKAFLCEGLRAVNRDYVRFLWSNDPHLHPRLIDSNQYCLGLQAHHFCYKRLSISISQSRRHP